MSSNTNNHKALRSILEKIHQPQLLDNHPWTSSLLVLKASADTPELLKKIPGERLAPLQLVQANITQYVSSPEFACSFPLCRNCGGSESWTPKMLCSVHSSARDQLFARQGFSIAVTHY